MIFKTKIDVVHINSTQFSNKMSHKAMNKALESIPSEVKSTPKTCPHFSRQTKGQANIVLIHNHSN